MWLHPARLAGHAMSLRMNRFLSNRWLRAVGVALALYAWPACAVDRDTSADRRPVAGGGASADAAAPPSLDFVLKDVDGKDVRLADFKGRPLLINVWATWCAPCKVEIPWFVEFADKYKDQNLTIVGISFDDSPDQIRKFAAEHHVNYTMLVGKGRDDLFAVYDPESVFPYSWFLKKDGTLQAKAFGFHPKEWFETNITGLF